MLVNNTFFSQKPTMCLPKTLTMIRAELSAGQSPSRASLGMSRKYPLNGGALRDIPKDSYDGDYQRGRDKKISPAPGTNQIAPLARAPRKKRTSLTLCNCDLQSYYRPLKIKKLHQLGFCRITIPIQFFL